MNTHPMHMKGKVALVVGADQPLGQAIAVLLSQLGAAVVVAATCKNRLAHTMELLEGSQHAATSYPEGPADALGQWMQALVKEVGRLDAVCFAEALDGGLSSRLYPAFGLVQGLRHKKVRAESSSLLYLLSSEGQRGSQVSPFMAASEGAIHAMTKALAMEVARDKIRVNCLAVGPMNSESLLPGSGTPQDVANAAAFLLSDTGLWITGTTLLVDGGFSLASQRNTP